MATSLTPTTGTTSGGSKKYLDFEGLNKLWDNICIKFAPTWKAVDFSHLAKTAPTHNASDITIPFRSITDEPNPTTGVVDHTTQLETTLTFNAATQTTAGVMTAADKVKLDNIGSTAENAVTIKNIKIGNQLSGGSTFNATALKIDNNKVVAFGLDYNADTDLLSLIDLNNNKAAVSQVHVLGDALKGLAFSDCKVKYENSNTYIVFTVTVTNQEGTTDTKTIEINVNDLISTYTAGDGISISQTSTSVDNINTATTITLIAPKSENNKNHKIGGIIPKKIYSNSVTDTNWGKATGTTVPTVQQLSTATSRYFGIETDNAGHAFVNVPVATITKGDNTTQSSTINNNDAQATFTAMTGLAMSLSADGQTYTYVPEITTYTLPKDDDLSISTNATTSDKGTIQLNGSTTQTIEFLTNATVNDHAIELVKGSYKIKETELTITADNSPNSVSLVPGSTSTLTFLEDISKDAHHTIKKNGVTLSIANPESIELTYIAGLKYTV